MTGDAPVTDKATGPWSARLDQVTGGIRIYGPDGKNVGIMHEDSGLLAVAAVNSYDESRALLEEAADMIERHTKSMRARHLPDHKQQDLIARIRAHLGEVK